MVSQRGNYQTLITPPRVPTWWLAHTLSKTADDMLCFPEKILPIPTCVHEV